eukprot:645405-Hanusia_phi.AAC.1
MCHWPAARPRVSLSPSQVAPAAVTPGPGGPAPPGPTRLTVTRGGSRPRGGGPGGPPSRSLP